MRNISLVVILFVYVSCTNEVVDTNTGSNFDNTDDSSYITNGSDSDTPTDKLDSTSETEETTDTGESGHTDTEPTNTDGDTTTQTRTPGHRDTSQDSLSDTEPSRPTDGDTGADTESATIGTDTGSEEDTALDTTPQDTEIPQDTETEVTCNCEGYNKYNPACREYCEDFLYPCFPENELFVREECCNCVNDPVDFQIYCASYCDKLKDTDNIDTDTGPEPNHECERISDRRCTSDEEGIDECQEIYNSELGIYENKWTQTKSCRDYESCYHNAVGDPQCERDELGDDLGNCHITEQSDKFCLRGHDIWWILICSHERWVLYDTCSEVCEYDEDSIPQTLVCGEDL